MNKINKVIIGSLIGVLVIAASAYGLIFVKGTKIIDLSNKNVVETDTFNENDPEAKEITEVANDVSETEALDTSELDILSTELDQLESEVNSF